MAIRQRVAPHILGSNLPSRKDDARFLRGSGGSFHDTFDRPGTNLHRSAHFPRCARWVKPLGRCSVHE